MIESFLLTGSLLCWQKYLDSERSCTLQIIYIYGDLVIKLLVLSTHVLLGMISDTGKE